MKKLVYVGCILVGLAFTQVYAADAPSFQIIERGKKAKAIEVVVPFTFLKDPRFFESESFRVVLGKSDETIRTDVADSEVRLRAANVLYHMEKAKRYFSEHLGYEKVKSLPQILLRVEMDVAFSSRELFDDKEAPFNDVYTIPPGTKWQTQTWFYKKKAIRVKDILAGLAEDPAAGEIQKIRRSILDWQTDLGIRNGVGLALGQNAGVREMYLSSLGSQLKSIVLAEVGLRLLKGLNRLFQPKYYFLDTALIPEVIYHEFTHIAFWDILSNAVSMPVPEGIANFFATQMIDHPKLTAKFKKAFTGRPANGNDSGYYQYTYEDGGEKARNDFVLGLLWQLRCVFGQEKAERLVLEAVKTGKLTGGFSKVRKDLLDALHLALVQVSLPEDLIGDQIRLGMYFKSKWEGYPAKTCD